MVKENDQEGEKPKRIKFGVIKTTFTAVLRTLKAHNPHLIAFSQVSNGESPGGLVSLESEICRTLAPAGAFVVVWVRKELSLVLLIDQ